MANFKESMEVLLGLEFSSSRDVLHKNKTENGFTFMGIYQGAHPSWGGWDIIENALSSNADIRSASEVLYTNITLKKMVFDFYEREFWNKMRLNAIESQIIADELFCFGVNAGIKTAVKLAQKLVGTPLDGIMGVQTLRALNSADEDKFSLQYDKLEIEYYESLVYKKPANAVYLKGWKKRANAV
ncbi:peptidoglycan domain protein [Campylobacter fetus]|uniref:glycoside hydrolase family 108 protein n=2 Tax=Campylobacter fetus TaxID=196 RepID=UPI00140DCD03|nr:putative peptidoglycan-binding domain-containing protein [Campylobacter fetus]QMS58106.1 peptidoglycan domain protein [Campylobacter fetus]QMS58553.1 peptidoglycan domain protein [Campylobacter fetus]QMS58749.1 peptidoglycan domain protein [Campylobacter fetus]QMS58827.1 peptidoglycan domain protein [Campylobacter fetus]